MPYEDNPYEAPDIAAEWIKAVEADSETLPQQIIYPALLEWLGSDRIKTAVDIGAGQGICSTKVQAERYIAIDPSGPLVQRARKLYSGPGRQFLIGDAYNLPIPDQTADVAFSLMVWLHVANPAKAAAELARVVKPGGRFFIFTANPAAYPLWEGFFQGAERHGNRLTGRIYLLQNPLSTDEPRRLAKISRSTLYLHTLADIIRPLLESGLEIEEATETGILPTSNGAALYIKIAGRRT